MVGPSWREVDDNHLTVHPVEDPTRRGPGPVLGWYGCISAKWTEGVREDVRCPEDPHWSLVAPLYPQSRPDLDE